MTAVTLPQPPVVRENDRNVSLTCAWCGNWFSLEYGQYRQRRRKSGSGFLYCGKRCSALATIGQRTEAMRRNRERDREAERQPFRIWEHNQVGGCHAGKGHDYQRARKWLVCTVCRYTLRPNRRGE